VSPTLGPAPRSGHFCCYDEAAHTAYIGHGLTCDGTALFDLWALDAIGRRWWSIPLRGGALPGRSGTRAALLGRLLYCFGGYADGEYLADLHTIDVAAGEVALLNTRGSHPAPRSTPIVAIYANRMYVWGGFNKDATSELNVLDLETMVWAQHPQEVAGRAAVPSVVVGKPFM
jgi:N-acetylneuraminic acid mutarotase